MEKLSGFALKYQWLFLLMILGVVSFSTIGVNQLTFKSDYKIFFKADNPQLKSFLHLQEIYSKNDNVAFIVAPKDGNLFSQQALTALRDLTEAAWQTQYSTRVDSITNFQHSTAQDDLLITEDLLPSAEDLNPEKIDQIKQVTLNEPLLINKLAGANGDAAVVNVTIALPGKDMTSEVPAVAQSARVIRDQFISKYPDMTCMLSGIVMLNNSYPEAAIDDAQTLLPIMSLVVILIVILFTRTLSGALATLGVIITSVAVTLGVWGGLGGYISGPSSSAVTILMTIAISDCVHLLIRFQECMRQGMEKLSALKESLSSNLQPIFLTSATTAVGFLTMIFSDSPPFIHLGILVAIGVMVTFIFSITLFPVLIAILPIKKIQPVSHSGMSGIDRFSQCVTQQPRRLLLITSFIMLGCAVFLPSNQLNDDLVKLFDKDMPFRQATDFMQAHVSGMTIIELSIDAHEESGISDIDYLNTVSSMTDWLRAQPETDHVSSITDTFKRLNQNMHGGDPAWYQLPEKKDLAAQYLLMYEMSLPSGLDLTHQINIAKSSTRIVATFQNMTSLQILEMEDRIQSHFEALQSGYDLTIAGPSLMFAHIGQTNIKGMLLGSTFALILIAILLGFVFKSAKYGFVSLVSNLMPAAAAFGLWGIFDGEVGLGLSVVMGISLGIIVDDTIHLLSHYVKARRVMHLSAEDAVQSSFAQVGKAVTVTTLALAAGFGVMAASSFKINADMGLLTAGTILIALFIDLLFLPSLLIALDSNTRPSFAFKRASV